MDLNLILGSLTYLCFSVVLTAGMVIQPPPKKEKGSMGEMAHRAINEGRFTYARVSSRPEQGSLKYGQRERG